MHGTGKCIAVTPCYTTLYEIAFTSGSKNSGSDHSPYLFLDLTNHDEGYVRFYNRPGDDMQKNKGDLWKFDISSFEINNRDCVKKSEINKVTIHNGGDWGISSVLTALETGFFSLY